MKAKTRHLLGELKPKRRSRGGYCKHCCELCHRPCKRRIRLEGREAVMCRSCDGGRRRRARGRGGKHRWAPIYYWREGEPKRYRCTHGSSFFVIAIAGPDESTIVCTFGGCHQVVNGFFFENELNGDE